MPKLADIVNPDVPCKVRHKEYHGTFDWNGAILRDSHGTAFLAGTVAMFSGDWQLAEPTVESVLRERGYGLFPLMAGFQIVGSSGNNIFHVMKSSKRPETVEQIAAILDLFDQYK